LRFEHSALFIGSVAEWLKVPVLKTGVRQRTVSSNLTASAIFVYKGEKMNEVKKGDTISVHYRGTLDDGSEFDNSYDRGEPMTIQAGMGNLIPGFDNALLGMSVGDTKTVNIEPENAYGQRNAEAQQTIPRDRFPEDFDLTPGTAVQGQNPQGNMFMATVESVLDDTVVLDLNHPLAGKNLSFEIELMNMSNPDAE
jgi:FKBP-type peptidyl-prolyl cis-trans isomerase 2